MALPVVAILGRQNVGKSTLLNRLVGRQLAIVEDLPGTTRDRIMAKVSWQGTLFALVDTGGLEIRPGSDLARMVKAQAEVAIAEADLMLFVVSVEEGLMADDQEIADGLRRAGKPIILVANKADNARLESNAADFYRLGLGEPLPISAHHGRGTETLLDRIIALLPPAATAPPEPEAMKIAIIGRANVGKSTLLNSLLGEERAIVDSQPGTTRDAVDTNLDFKGQNVLLIDTAGIRRRGRQDVGIERYGVIRALRAIDRADVVILVLDATEMVTAQDKHVAGYIQQAAKGAILVVNKWDLVSDNDTATTTRNLKNELKFMAYAPVLFVSAKLARGTERILPQAQLVCQERAKRLTTSEVNKVVQEALAAHNLPRRGGRQLKVRYATQAETNPPTFVFFVNDHTLVHFSYRRYLENRLRDAFGFTGTPLRLTFKSAGGKP
ncbi:MAG: ribosome biogenesis GTPase Der [Chloroflexota bacterium]